MQYPNVPDQSRESFLIALGSSGNEFPFAALEIVGANRFHRRPHGRWDNGRCMELNFMTCSVKSSLLAFGFYRVSIEYLMFCTGFRNMSGYLRTSLCLRRSVNLTVKPITARRWPDLFDSVTGWPWGCATWELVQATCLFQGLFK